MHTYSNNTTPTNTPQFNPVRQDQMNYPQHQQSQYQQYQQQQQAPAQAAQQYDIAQHQQHSLETVSGKQQQVSSSTGGWPTSTARTQNPYQQRSSNKAPATTTLPRGMVAPPQQHPGHILAQHNSNAPAQEDTWDNQQFQPPQFQPINYNQQYHQHQAPAVHQHSPLYQQQQQQQQHRQFSGSSTSMSHASESYGTRRSSATSGGSSSNGEGEEHVNQPHHRRQQVPLTYYPTSSTANNSNNQQQQLAQSQRSGNSSLGASQKTTTTSSSNSKCTPRLLRLRDPISIDEIQLLSGSVRAKAVTNNGASQIQAAFEQHPMETVEILGAEIQSHMAFLVLDKYGSYVVRALLQSLEKDDAIQRLSELSTNEDLLLTMCTKDLHSRRMVQFLLEFKGPERCRYLFDLVMRRPMQIVRTQQGCITLQRILDEFSEDREKFFDIVRTSFMEYVLDPFGNYIIQYMLAEGNQVENSNTLALYCRGQLHNMICHKYASNVIEKCFGLVTPELQREIIEELFNAPEEAVKKILTDPCANYVVQAAIRTASYRDVTLIERRVTPLLDSIPYGNKIKARLTRRLAAH